jgi:hypothetical protein
MKCGRKKGSIPWNKGLKTGLVPKTAFKKGSLPWNTGKKTGYKPWTTGLKAKDNKKLAGILEMAHNALRGKPAWNKGLGKSKILKGLPKGEKNWKWKGDDVGYFALHHWINRTKGKATICEHCGSDGGHIRKCHWANVSGEYRRDINDYISLCAKCHKKYDQKVRG